jgi:hypothetical protein
MKQYRSISKLILSSFILFWFSMSNGMAQRNVQLLIEAESFKEKGGWLVDPQFVEQMGSPYLLAHGLGVPVENAKTIVTFSERGKYHIYVRTKNWAPGNWKAPGRFKLSVNNQEIDTELGTQEGWNWQYAGSTEIGKGEIAIEIKDLTGFEGRCDAICFSTNKQAPPNDAVELKNWRKELLSESEIPQETHQFDLVVVGGGIAGCAAAVAAAEQGLQVALIHDRPVLGGNASSEIRVHTLGITGNYDRILKNLNTKHYPNGSPESVLDDQKRHQYIESFDNISLFLNWRVYTSNIQGSKITSVDARHTSTGELARFSAPLFVDCTGDGWIGFWAGAEYRYGRDAESDYDEAMKNKLNNFNFRKLTENNISSLSTNQLEEYAQHWSPAQKDGKVMGSSVLWRSIASDKTEIFPEVPWAMEVAGNHSAVNGEWYWEYSTDSLNQIEDGEQIRDHLFRAIYGSFYNAKKDSSNAKQKLEWVSYLLGKRESRRLVGDYIYTFNDIAEMRQFPDGVVKEEREVDVHFQSVLSDSTKPDFMSEALFYNVPSYTVPYRSLYSKNIDNLFMAGRCFSCSHVGLGGPRVMNTTGQMGVAVGLAASVCKKHKVNPRAVYTDYLEEYMELINRQKQD